MVHRRWVRASGPRERSRCRPWQRVDGGSPSTRAAAVLASDALLGRLPRLSGAEMPPAVTAARARNAGQGESPGTPRVRCGLLGAGEQQPQPGQVRAALWSPPPGAAVGGVTAGPAAFSVVPSHGGSVLSNQIPTEKTQSLQTVMVPRGCFSLGDRELWAPVPQ